MKPLLVSLTIGACCALAVAQTKSVVTVSSDEHGYSWAPFAPKDGRFSVLMPATPVGKTTVNETADGKVVFHSFAVEINEAFFQVGYSEYAVQLSEERVAKVMLDRRRETISKHNGKFSASAQFLSENFPAVNG